MSLSKTSKETLQGGKDVCEDVDDASSAAGDSSGNVDASKSNLSTTDTNQSGTTDDEIQNIKNALTKRESQQVFRLRLLVMLILIAAATSISFTIFRLERSSQLEEFESDYYGVAEKIITSLQEVTKSISAIAGLAVTVTVDAHNKVGNASTVDTENLFSGWPFITIDAFQERATNARAQAGSIFVSLNPIVESDQLSAWEKYLQSDVNTWIADGMSRQQEKGLDHFIHPTQIEKSWLTEELVDPLHTFDSVGNPVLSQSDGPFLPRWQTSPVLPTNIVNENLFENEVFSELTRDCIASKSAVLGGFHIEPPGSSSHPDRMTTFFATLLSMSTGKEVEYPGDPDSHMAIPIFDTLNGTDRKVVGVIESAIYWRWFLRNILPKNDFGITVIITNECDGSFTYHLDGPEASAIGFEDRHDRKFSMYGVEGLLNKAIIEDGTIDGVPFHETSCPYTFHVYPEQEYYDHYVTNEPLVISLSVAAVFAFTIAMFLVYDRLVERRQRLVLAKATQSTAIISSLFPKQVRDRLLAMETQKNEKRKGDSLVPANHKLKTFLNGNELAPHIHDQPIADFFPNCTVFFADIAGFTAWSSTREPAQVFILLQTVYQNFDLIAKRRRVFKVETIGDSYVAVTGLPEPQSNHATIMVKFAWDCLIRIGEITKELEVTLGPDTNDLSMRFGLHSGSITAGVLKGDRARFQLFGDTVNTASRMESTGVKGRIQVSEATADILRKVGKGSWLTKRIDQVNAKGKGVLNTYWVALKSAGLSAGTGSSSDEIHSLQLREVTPTTSMPKRVNGKTAQREARLVDWMTEVLVEHITTVVIVRDRCPFKQENSGTDMVYEAPPGTICLDEVQDFISMPEFNAEVAEAALDAQLVNIPKEITSQLREYVTLIARSYRSNPFHNFEHACHVTMSVSKLLRRIVAPDLISSNSGVLESRKGRHDIAAEIHNFTHGLTSDPMASFAIVFSALIHDTDHQGVSNAQLIKEEPTMGELYRYKSVAEQNSLDVAWDLLMSEQFIEMRRYIFASEAELMRFRQLIVNIVLATDIFDKEIGDRRKARWEQAFHEDGSLSRDTISNMRATIVLEHIIQASDVSHTMQHWHVYQKWNRKLFLEMYQAWKDGRMGADPLEFWYKGELGFFDNYVIPLANKLKECNVFGVSSDEYLGYALRNRAEWEERGEEILKSIVNECSPVLGIVREAVGRTFSTCSDTTEGCEHA